MRTLEKTAVILAVVAFVGGPAAVLFDQWGIALKITLLLLFTWLVWLTVEVLAIRKVLHQVRGAALPEEQRPGLVLQDFTEGPVFVHSRAERPDHDIPCVDSKFLDLSEATFSVWILVDARWRKGMKTPTYLVSHTSDPDQASGYPNSFSIVHHYDSPSWGLRFHGDPKRPKPQGERNCHSLPKDVGVRLFSLRWSRRKGDVQLLIDNEVRIRLSGQVSWPSPAGEPVYLGGWVRQGWDSYIRSKLYWVRVFDSWLSEEEIGALVAERPEL